MSRVVVRPGRDADAADFIALIGICWSEYPGCVLDVDGELPELHALASNFTAKHGALWAADAGGAVVGMIGIAPFAQGSATWELSRLYVAPCHRGTGLAADLLSRAECHAVARGADRLVLWTDTRFIRAHRFYEKHGWCRTGETRALADLSRTVEYRFVKDLFGCGSG